MKPVSLRPRSGTATEQSPGAKGKRENNPNRGKGSGLTTGTESLPARRCPGFNAGKTTTDSNTANRADSPTDEREGKCRVAFFGQRLLSRRLQQLIIFLSVLGYYWCPPHLPPQ